MAMISQSQFAQSLCRLVSRDESATDADLIARFLARRDEGAFTAIVRRHGAMVFGVCRRLLRHCQDAEDAFQATFLVLARKAHAITDRAALANWLYGVAFRTALKARTTNAKRLAKEMRMRPMQEATTVADPWSDLEAVLDQELQRLADKYRLPVVLCDLEGLSRKAAAERLGVPEGTLSGQLFRARRMLAGRLRRSGVTLSAGALATMLGQASAMAAPSQAMVHTTVKAGVIALTSPAALPGLISSPVLSLTNGVIKAMYVNNLQKLAGSLVAVVAALGIGWGSLAAGGPSGAATQNAEPMPKGEAKAQGAPEKSVEDLADSLAGLLRNRKVLRDLKCTIEQWDKLEDILEAADKRIQKAVTAMQNVPPPLDPTGQPDFEAMTRQWTQVSQGEYKTAAKEISANVLKAEQVKRLVQLDLQSRGIEAFQREAVSKALELTDKQKAQVKELGEKAKEEMQGKLQGNANGGQIVIDCSDHMKEAEAAFAKAAKAAQDLLTPEQRKTWNEMVGKTATFPMRNTGSGMMFPGGAFRVFPAPVIVPPPPVEVPGNVLPPPPQKN